MRSRTVVRNTILLGAALAAVVGLGSAAPAAPAHADTAITEDAWVAAVDNALDWLEANQAHTGAWLGAEPVRDTATALATLRALRPSSAAVLRAEAWLANQCPNTTDGRSRLLAAIGGAGLVPRSVISQLVCSRNPVDYDPSRPNYPEGGWGVADNYGSDVIDTSLALAALPSAGLAGGMEARDESVASAGTRLYDFVLPEGASDLRISFRRFSGRIALRVSVGVPPNLSDPYWLVTDPSYLDGLPPDAGTWYIRVDGLAPVSTYDLLVDYVIDGFATIAIPEAIDYLRVAQNPDGGWGLQVGGASDVAITAVASDSLLAYAGNYDVQDSLDAAATYLVNQQSSAGTWGGDSVAATALAYKALRDLGVTPTNATGAEIFLYYSQLKDGSWAHDPYLTALVAGLGLPNPGLDAVPGDCNGDKAVNAGDIAATILEIFDGDGSHRGFTIGGTFSGRPLGCDANEDIYVNAGDISCTILLIFVGPGACSR